MVLFARDQNPKAELETAERRLRREVEQLAHRVPQERIEALVQAVRGHLIAEGVAFAMRRFDDVYRNSGLDSPDIDGMDDALDHMGSVQGLPGNG